MKSPQKPVSIQFVICGAFLAFWVYFLLFPWSYYSTADKAVETYFRTFADKDNDKRFVNISPEKDKELLEAIMSRAEFKVEDVNKVSTNQYDFIIDLRVPSLAACIAKNYPELFTYSNEAYLTSKLNVMSEEDYIDEFFNELTNAIKTSTVYYEARVQLSVVKDNNEWTILSTDELDNHLLGNILSYQNDDVSFLSLKELLLPDKEGKLKTSTTDIFPLN